SARRPHPPGQRLRRDPLPPWRAPGPRPPGPQSGTEQAGLHALSRGYISMSGDRRSIQELVAERNSGKLLFTAGPASLLSENLSGLRPCFGRGDADYARLEEEVLAQLLAMSGHRRIARMQGSASLALEIMALNFLHGRVVVIDTGYYARRLHAMADSCRRRGGAVRELLEVRHDEVAALQGRFDWVVACSTETSSGYRQPIADLAQLSARLGARLMLDATASIGL